MEILFLFVIFSVGFCCEPSLNCEECHFRLCFFLKQFDGNFTCSSVPETEESKYVVDSCEMFQESNHPSETAGRGFSSNVESVDHIQTLNNTTLTERPTSQQPARSVKNNQPKLLPFQPSLRPVDYNRSSAEQLDLYNMRLKRNFCHQVRLLKLFKKKTESKSLDLLLEQNPYANDDKFCLNIIRARRVERLANCTACSANSINVPLKLTADGCNPLVDCINCVARECNYIINNNGDNFCSNISNPIPAGSTVVPPNETLWCPKTPATPATSGYEVGFWILISFLLISLCGGCVGFFIKKKRANRHDSTEEYLLNTPEIQTTTHI